MPRRTIEVPIGLVKLVHEMANEVRNSHGGWWESHCTTREKKLVEFSDRLKEMERIRKC